MSAGKGDRPRAVNGEVFRRNYDAIFSHADPNLIKWMEKSDNARTKHFAELRGISPSDVVTTIRKIPVP